MALTIGYGYLVLQDGVAELLHRACVDMFLFTRHDVTWEAFDEFWTEWSLRVHQ